MIQGGCFCGAIRYQANSTPLDETNCHCSICRRISGAPYVSWFSVPKSSFKFICGEPQRFQSTARAWRAFCPDCGTPLTFEHDDFPDAIDVTTCSLDRPELFPPKDNTRTSSKLPWVHLSDLLPAYLESRDRG